MKILICSLTYPLLNGVTVSINASADGLIAKGDEVLVVAPKYKEGRNRPEHRPVPSSYMAKTLGSLIGKDERTFGITAFYHIQRIIKEFNPDLFWLHTLTWAPNAFELNMLKSKKPKVLTYHTLVEAYGRIYGGEIGANLMKRRSVSVCNKMDVVITPSKIIEKKLRSYGVTKPIYPIPTGINKVEKYFTKKELHEEFNIPLDSKILISVGRICKEKNIDALLKIMKKIKKRNKDIFLLLIGPGEADEFKEIAKKLDISDRVIFTGPLPVEKVQKSYGGADVFVFASKTDTQGLVIGEAMMAEIPVVALSSQIIPDVYPERTLFVSDNQPKFIDDVFSVLENKEKREKRVKEAKKFVLENFSREAMTRKQRELFLGLHNK